MEPGESVGAQNGHDQGKDGGPGRLHRYVDEGPGDASGGVLALRAGAEERLIGGEVQVAGPPLDGCALGATLVDRLVLSAQ